MNSSNSKSLVAKTTVPYVAIVPEPNVQLSRPVVQCEEIFDSHVWYGTVSTVPLRQGTVPIVNNVNVLN